MRRENELSASCELAGVMSPTQPRLTGVTELALAGTLHPSGTGGVSQCLRASPQVGEDLQFNTQLFS